MPNLRLPSLITTTAGTIPQGFLAATILNRGPAAGTVDGVELIKGAKKNYVAVSGRVYDPVEYDPDGNTFVVSVLLDT